MNEPIVTAGCIAGEGDHTWIAIGSAPHRQPLLGVLPALELELVNDGTGERSFFVIEQESIVNGPEYRMGALDPGTSCRPHVADERLGGAHALEFRRALSHGRPLRAP